MSKAAKKSLRVRPDFSSATKTSCVASSTNSLPTFLKKQKPCTKSITLNTDRGCDQGRLVLIFWESNHCDINYSSYGLESVKHGDTPYCVPTLPLIPGIMELEILCQRNLCMYIRACTAYVPDYRQALRQWTYV